MRASPSSCDLSQRESASPGDTRISILNGCLRVCGGDVARSSNCTRERQCVPNLESIARYCDTRTTLCMTSRAWNVCSAMHGRSSELRLSSYQQQEQENGKRLWSRRAQRREMIHGLRPVRRRAARPCRRIPCTHSPRIFPSLCRRHDAGASTPGRSRDRALSAEQQIHRRSRARNRANSFFRRRRASSNDQGE